ncbi:MAG: Yip1 family protein [Bacteroidales bacterium]|nr:YIP1 family protein [Bacteroidales bacterium]
MDFKKIWERIKGIIANPTAEWDKITAEPNDQNEMIINYVVPIVALGAITTFIGKASMGDISVYQGFMLAITYFISMVAGIYISAVVVSELEPGFNVEKDFGGTLKLIVYSATASLVASVVASLHPGLSFIGLFGLYSLYLFWVGLPKIMDVAEDKKVGFVLIAALIILAITFILNFILQSIFVASSI